MSRTNRILRSTNRPQSQVLRAFLSFASHTPPATDHKRPKLATIPNRVELSDACMAVWASYPRHHKSRIMEHHRQLPAIHKTLTNFSIPVLDIGLIPRSMIVHFTLPRVAYGRQNHGNEWHQNHAWTENNLLRRDLSRDRAGNAHQDRPNDKARNQQCKPVEGSFETSFISDEGRNTPRFRDMEPQQATAVMA